MVYGTLPETGNDPFGFPGGQKIVAAVMSGVLAGCCSVPFGHGRAGNVPLNCGASRSQDGNLPLGESR
ncbi:hypothetical protein D3C80_2055680 [compost metagenome]